MMIPPWLYKVVDGVSSPRKDNKLVDDLSALIQELALIK
jgi:hypothetical protein